MANKRKKENPGTGENDLAIPGILSAGGPVLGVGIDLVAHERVARMLDRFGERFLKRCFTPVEAEYCMSRRDSIPELGVRLAAKEACFKAIGGRRGMGLGWRDFEVVLDSDNVPFIRLNGRAMDRGRDIGAGKVWLSLTHEDLWSAAVVVIMAHG